MPPTISSNAKRGTGILNNEAYISKLVWNRQRYVKNPETGKRQARFPNYMYRVMKLALIVPPKYTGIHTAQIVLEKLPPEKGCSSGMPQE
mgnify:CR=1 FL=1